MDENNFMKAIQKAKQKSARKEKFESRLIDKRYSNFARGVISPQIQYSMQMFRHIAEKAWLINTIIGHLIDKTMPYIRPMSARGRRGFAIELKDPDKKMTAADKKRAKEIQEFFLKTGWDNSLQHEDDLIAYTKKILRDVLTMDQTASEKLWSRGGELLSFEAIDGATILRCTEDGYLGDDKIRFVQMVDGSVCTQYNSNQILFQYMNPRTDIKHFGYGYSKIEQSISLVISLINSFQFNAGAFTEDKLPRGMLLMNGDIGFDEVEEIEDYLIDVMGPNGIEGATAKWGIPIIPTGKGGDKASITWQALGSSNQDMQYSRWQDTLYMSIGSVYGVDIESMGIKSEKGAKIMESGSAEGKKYSDDKGIGNALTFLERHFQHYLDLIDDRFTFVFHGFEQDDAKDLRDATKAELESFKTVNDILRENDMPESEFKFADCPGIGSPQILQAYMAETGQEEGGEGMPGEEGESGAEESPESEPGEEPAEEDWDEDEWGFEKSLPEPIRIKI